MKLYQIVSNAFIMFLCCRYYWLSTYWPKNVSRKEPLLLEEGGDARSEVKGGVAEGVAAVEAGERETEIMSLDFWSSEQLKQMDWGSFWRKEALT